MAEDRVQQSGGARDSVSVHDAELRPYDRYGRAVDGLAWRPINYDAEQGAGSFVMSIAPGATTPPHEHQEIEEILVLEGDFIDSDGTSFEPGDLISYAPGTRHWSTSQNGCRILVHVRAYGRPLEPSEQTAV
ncbi:MAG: cupin domain-containing protein [Halofilum sp. (in: g-proteobacteria)]